MNLIKHGVQTHVETCGLACPLPLAVLGPLHSHYSPLWPMRLPQPSHHTPWLASTCLGPQDSCLCPAAAPKARGTAAGPQPLCRVGADCCCCCAAAADSTDSSSPTVMLLMSTDAGSAPDSRPAIAPRASAGLAGIAAAVAVCTLCGTPCNPPCGTVCGMPRGTPCSTACD